MQQASSQDKKKKRLIKIRLQKLAPLYPSLSHGQVWEQMTLRLSSVSGGGRKGKQCQRCRTYNVQAARFCMQCGTSFQVHQPQATQTTQTNTKQSRHGTKQASSFKPWYTYPSILLVRALVFLSLIALIGNITHGNFSFGSTSATSASQEDVNAPAIISTPKVFQWTTTHTFSDSGSQQTDTFSVRNEWHIVWSCDPASVDGQAYFLMIEIDYPNGSVAESGVDVMCTKEHTHDVYVVRSIGTFSLHIMSIGAWTVEVQEWKLKPSNEN